MTIHTIRPNGTLVANAWTAHGAASPALAASDASDASYVQSTDVNEIKFQFADYALAAGERCSRVRVKMRTQSADGTPATQMAIGAILGDGTFWHPADATIASTLAEFDATIFATTPSGGEWTQSEINAIQARVLCFGTTAGVTPKLMDIWVDLDVRTQAFVTLNPLGTVTTTHAPTISWNVDIHDGQPQVAYQIKAYDLSKNAAPDPSSADPHISGDGLVWDTSGVNGNATSLRVPSTPNGSYRYFVRVAKDFNGSHWWSAWSVHTDLVMNTNPAPPTSLAYGPVSGGNVISNTPAFVAISPIPPTDNAAAAPNKVAVQWQVARDAAFATSPQTISELDANGAVVWHSVSARTGAALIPLANPLGIGTWYVRMRALDFYGGVSTWTAATTFTVAHPPAATVLAPFGGLVAAYDGTNGNVFQWQFASTSPDERQTAYRIIIEDNVDGSLVLDTGKVTSAISQASIIVPATYKDQALRWKVSVWDSDDVQSAAFSSYGVFQVSDAPTVTIAVTPSPATSPQPSISWTVAGSSGRVQTAYRVAIIDDNDNIIYDTNKVVDGVTTSITVPDASLLVNTSNYTAWLFIWDNYGLTNSTSEDFSTEWTEPAAPAFVVDVSPIDVAGYVSVTWNVDDIDPNWVLWRIYRRDIDANGSWELLVEDDTVQTDHEFHDFVVKANTTYEYVVVQVISEFSALVESVYTPTMVNSGGSLYWLLCPDDFGLSVRLPIVKDDAYTDEHETQELLLVGRGRKVDFGTHYGKKGTLTAQLRDDAARSITARQQKQAIEDLQNIQTALWLRTPFGDIWQVAATDINVSRIAGTGASEFCDLSVPYEEVA